ncbi:MAG: putative CXXCH cytochrome family protein [Kiritimatiellia bacterium]|jgi:predicted CXXCH cytochrome family protein
MKTEKVGKGVLSVLAGFAVMATVAQGQGTAGIENSGHNFGIASWNTDTQEICLPCHAPHGNGFPIDGMPLWNHEPTTQTFIPYGVTYNSDTLDAIVGQPEGASKLCLSCHDGTVALDSWTRHAGSTFMGFGPGTINHWAFGSDLGTTHPLSFTYDTALANADGELHDPSTIVPELGKSITDALLFNGKMECSSCHDVHNAAGHDALLHIENIGSALCLTCHDK